MSFEEVKKRVRGRGRIGVCILPGFIMPDLYIYIWVDLTCGAMYSSHDSRPGQARVFLIGRSVLGTR